MKTGDRVALRGIQSQSVALNGTQWHSVALSGHLRSSSEVIDETHVLEGNGGSISGNQWPSEVIDETHLETCERGTRLLSRLQHERQKKQRRA